MPEKNHRSSQGRASVSGRLAVLKRFLGRALLYPLLYPLFRRYVVMPGSSYRGRAKPLNSKELVLRERLEQHVAALATQIGERHHMQAPAQEALNRSAAYIAGAFAKLGLVPVITTFTYGGMVMQNVEVCIQGRRNPNRYLVVGAHYDTVRHCPGADDNASGVAGLIELARLLKDDPAECSVRLVAYANEEDSGGPWEAMGSYHHARACRQRDEDLLGMISLEMLGYYDPAEGSQKYPFPFNLFYPSRGDFIAFVGNSASRQLVRTCVAEFRVGAAFPSEGVAAPERFADIARSDHWSYWQHGCQAMMVTDTSNFRNPYLHTTEDTADKLDFESMTRVVAGLHAVVLKLAV